MRAAILLAVIAVLLPNAAEAKRTQGLVYNYDNDGRTLASEQARPDRVRHARTTAQHREVRSGHRRGRGGYAGAQILGGRPAGCPQKFCGCGTSIKLFGRIRPELNLAANWLRKFPRTAPASMMVAARSGHVMLLLEHVGGDKWKVWDANSGGGLTRIHVRSLRGFAVVNPHSVIAMRPLSYE